MPVRKSQDKEDGFFAVIAVTCFRQKDGSKKFARTVRVDFLQRSTAYHYCDQLQDQIDADCDPARSYVIDADGMPIRAGRSAWLPSNYFLYPEKSRRYAA
jgi:hypothetical protein